jgi:hypothetical protein
MPRWISSSLAFLVVTLALASLAPAGPVHYQESISGDLSNNGDTPLTLFKFDTGANTISGTTGVSTTTKAPFTVSDPDAFAFIVPAGLQVTTANVSIPTKTGDIAMTTWNLFAGSAEPAGGTPVQGIDVPVTGSVTLSATPLSAGTYNITQTSWLANPPATANYTFTFNVATIPVPNAALLGLLGLPIVALAPRSRRRA